MRRHKLFKAIIVSIGLIAGSAAAEVRGLLPVGQAEHEFIYDYLERIDALSLDDHRWETGPYRTDAIDIPLGPLQTLLEPEEGGLRLFTLAATNIRAAQSVRGRSFELLRFGGAGRPLNNLFIYASATLDESRARDVSYTGKKWRGFAGDVENAFVWYGTKKFDLIAGRFAEFWGLRRSLIFAGNDGLDGFSYRFHWGKLSISYRLARLDGLNPSRDNVPQFENRYIAAHRFDFHFSPLLRVGLFETVLFGGPGRQIDLFYLNPLIFFHGSQLNEGTNDNTLLGFDYTVKPRAGIKLYGQLLIDDLQVDDRTQSDQEPNEIAFRFGGYLADLIPALDLRVEYTRVTNWTFNQLLARNRYLHQGRPVGAVRGNDYDEAELMLTRWFGPGLSFSLRTSYWRQGEGRISADWTQPWLLISGDYSEPFPTGTVQETFAASLEARGFAAGHFYFAIATGIESVRNFSNRPDDNRTLPFVQIAVSTFISVPLSLE